MEHPAGFEPATSRLTDEVTAIFTTDHAIDWRGTDDAEMILERAPRSTGIKPLRTRIVSLVGYVEVSASSPPPCCCAWLRNRKKGASGNRRNRLAMTTTQRLLSKVRNPRHAALARRLHGTCNQRRGPNPAFVVAKYPRSSPLTFIEPQNTARNFQGNRRVGAPHRGRFDQSDVSELFTTWN